MHAAMGGVWVDPDGGLEDDFDDDTEPYDRCHYHVPPGHTRVTVESGHIRVKVVRAY